MKYNIILATDSEYGISKNNIIPWNIKEDMLFFKNITTNNSKNNVVIMGKNTALSLSKPLLNRINICISSSIKELNGFIIEKDLESAIKKAETLIDDNSEIFIIGGSKLYNETLESYKFDKIYYTHINKNYNCDNKVNYLLNKSNMNYEIINKKYCIDKNINEDIELTFYLITLKN